MEQLTTVLDLSDEMLLHVLSYVQIRDIINLSETCSRFDRLLQDRTLCRHITVPWNVDVQRKSLARFLAQPDRASIITKLTLHDVYWIPSGAIKEIVFRLRSLQELYVAGTSLTYNHLLQILGNPSTKLSALSWTWDHELEYLLRPNFRKLNLTRAAVRSELIAVLDKFELLRYLLIHVPDVFNGTRVYDYDLSHSSLCFLVSLCTNLEQLWILSWPNTPQEKGKQSIPYVEGFRPVMKFPRLHTFVISVLESPKIHVRSLTRQTLNSFKLLNSAPAAENTVKEETDSFKTTTSSTAAKNVWVYHASPCEIFSFPMLAMEMPMLDLKSTHRICLPLTSEVVQVFDSAGLDQCKHLSLTYGGTLAVSLNRLLQGATNLESFQSKTFNSKLDWQEFVQSHPKLRAINVSEEMSFYENMCFRDACLAMGKLNHLEKLSLPVNCLAEILSKETVADYYQKLSIGVAGQPTSEGQARMESGSSRGDELVSDLFSKGKRVGRKGDVSRKSNSISGLDYLTLFCPHIEEFEMGFTRWGLGSTLVIGSLANISRWTHLKRLTLDSLPTTYGQFLIDIARGASNLESLRLKDLGPSGKCVYINSLCTALKLWSKLKDFRFEQKYIGSTKSLCQALEYCPELERIFLYVSSNDVPLEPNEFLRLMNQSRRLFVLYVTLGSATKASCIGLRKELEFLYKGSRPSLSVAIQTRMDEEIIKFHSVHYRDMVVHTPRVCTYTSFPTAND